MQLEQRQQVMLQLHLSDQQVIADRYLDAPYIRGLTYSTSFAHFGNTSAQDISISWTVKGKKIVMMRNTSSKHSRQ